MKKRYFLLSALAAAAVVPGIASANLLLDLPPILAGEPCCNPCDITCTKPCKTCTTCCGTICMDSNTTCSVCCYGTCSTTTCSDPVCTADTGCEAGQSCCGGQCSDTACQCTVETEEDKCGTGNYCCDGFCNATSCPECTTDGKVVDDDCPADKKYCSSGRCVECTQNSHCTEDKQCISGQCRVPSDSKLNDTGIKWSGDASSNADTCTDNRQDCGYGTNIFSFSSTTTGGCVADSVTGLTWSPDQGTAAWTGIAEKVTAANTGSGLCGKTNWRAATLKELLSIVSYNNMSSTPLVDSSFSITLKTDKPYWSGSAASDSTKAWGASFSSGWSSQLAKSDSYNVILVSGDAPASPDFQDNTADGTVTDNNTGLIWQKCLAGYSGNNCATVGTKTTFTWAEALKHAADAGPDWRLPNLKEIQSIVDETKSSPAINSIFPNANYSVWSSSPSSLTGSVGGVTKWKSWIIDFSSGSIGDSFRDSTLHVRLVKDPTN